MLREQSFFYREGGRLFVGGPEVFEVVKGGTIFLSRQREGEPEKIGDWPSQTDAPLPSKK